MAGTDRTVEVLFNGYWEEIPFNELKEGDIFRLFEKDGSEVDGGQICEAETDAYTCECGVLTVKSRPGGRVTNVTS